MNKNLRVACWIIGMFGILYFNSRDWDIINIIGIPLSVGLNAMPLWFNTNTPKPPIKNEG